MHNMKPGSKVLVTTDNWFYGRDGKSYRGVWGTFDGVFGDQETLGIKTNSRSSNWYAVIGGMIVAGCQIHYAMDCPEAPPDEVEDHGMNDGNVVNHTRPSHIYKAD